MTAHLTYLESGVVGLIQGVSEMFPISSLGHNVLIPAIVGGSWARDLDVASPESPYLAFIVGLHVATAIALLIYFWRDWVRIVGGFFSSLRDLSVETADQKLAWMIILATIPVGIVGVAFEHTFRVLFAKPILAGVFLMVNGLILLAGERYRTRASLAADAAIAAARAPAAPQSALRESALGESALREREPVTQGPAVPEHAPAVPLPGMAGPGMPETTVRAPLPGAEAPWRHARGQPARAAELADARQADRRLASMGYAQAVIIGSAQILALLAGISRDGVTIVTGLARGLSRQDAARFAFLLATPVILAAGALKIPDLLGPLGNGIRGQILLGSVLSGVGAYLSVRFLLRYLRTRTLTPFGVYCLIAGLASVIYLGLVR
ncbi:MAG TPA: undecaprenyl-diphosphate phosphatase [Streptosporangiaceae bacterium]|nr:undecaprenyl-diphosphate phosphatase [Streptosporangiaceae bacterium]